jgi:hypothetical protein
VARALAVLPLARAAVPLAVALAAAVKDELFLVLVAMTQEGMAKDEIGVKRYVSFLPFCEHIASDMFTA